MALSVLQHLPTGLIGSTDKLARLINNHIGPMIGSSYGISLGLLAKLMSASFSNESEVEMPEGARFEQEIWSSIVSRVYAEDVQGISADAVLFLQKVNGLEGWGSWGDYDTLVPRLTDTLRARGVRLRVDVLYAEKDQMIGDQGAKGPRWFDQCWNETSRGDAIDYQSRTIPGADHDRIWDLRWGAAHEVFERIGEPAAADQDHEVI